MLRSVRTISPRAAALLAAALATTISMPQAVQAQPSAFRSPQFIATAAKFKALHETHYNWMGSDEVYALLYDFPAISLRRTATFGDVDAGETRNFSSEDSCISPLPRCERGGSSLGFGIALYEQDQPPFQFCHGSLDPSPPTPEDYERRFDAVGDSCDDDLIGKAKVKLSQAELMAMLPTVGQFIDTTVTLTGGAGRYEFTYRLTRLADRLNIPPIGPPVVVVTYPIALQATAATQPSRAVLTWSGANTSMVDIYRDGVKFTTTGNNGSFNDTRPPGTYQYRLCEQGSTTVCSAVVAVTVI